MLFQSYLELVDLILSDSSVFFLFRLIFVSSSFFFVQGDFSNAFASERISA